MRFSLKAVGRQRTLINEAWNLTRDFWWRPQFRDATLLQFFARVAIEAAWVKHASKPPR